MTSQPRLLLALFGALSLVSASGCSRTGLFICGNPGDPACPDGYSCVDNRCTPGATGCQAGETTCAGRCVDLATEEAHCGACGRACGAGSVCQNGSCSTACPGGQAFCNGRCQDVTTDRLNCGSCGQACDSLELCAGGACRCDAPLVDCGNLCTDTRSDGDNCGRCGVACADGRFCQAGSCVASCAPGLSVCDDG
ncbi:MAG TPA: hypothetical protein VGE37_13540, partial [Archangium sp.]